MRWLLLSFLLCGCAAAPTRKQSLQVATPPLPEVAAEHIDGLRADAPDWPLPPKPIYLVWDNPNPIEDRPFILTEIQHTTDATKAFEFMAFVGASTNHTMWIEVTPTNTCEFFIARFVNTNSLPWVYSDWSRK